MIEDDFMQIIEHAKDRSKHIERSTCYAFKIDDKDGLAQALGFSNTMLSKVDYFVKNDDAIQLIELSDLEDQIQKCRFNEIQQLATENTNKLTAKEKRFIRKTAWSPMTNEFKRKWGGSIAIIERLYRKNRLCESDPNYQLLIVCKNQTDVIMLDALKVQLEGMMRIVQVCRTKDLSRYLIEEKR